MTPTKRIRNGRVSWRVQYRVDGKPHEKTFAFERDAKRYDREVHRALDLGSYVNPNDPTTLGTYAAEYLSTRAHGPSSRSIYARYLKRINESGLGGRPIGKVRPSEVTGWVTRQQDSGLAPRTVQLMVTFLRSVYAAAVADGRGVTVSPVPRDLHLSAGDEDAGEVMVPSIEDVDAFADAMTDLNPRCRMLVLIQAGAGLRIGEALALRREDVDFARHQIRVCGRVLGRERVPGCKGSRGARVKTRTVPLLPDVAKELAAHMLAYPPADVESAIGAPFTDSHGRLWSLSSYGYWFGLARDAAGLSSSVSSHTLRHHFASVALSKNVPIKDVATFLGHEARGKDLRARHGRRGGSVHRAHGQDVGAVGWAGRTGRAACVEPVGIAFAITRGRQRLDVIGTLVPPAMTKNVGVPETPLRSAPSTSEATRAPPA